MSRRNAAWMTTAIALIVSIYGCADSTLTREPAARRPYASEPVDHLCDQADPRTTGDEPQEPAYDGCTYDSPPQLVPDRPAFPDGDAFMAEADRRADLQIADLYALEQQQSYPSLRAYLDPNEWTQETAEAGAGSEDATGNEGVAYANDGVTRADFPVGDGILSLLNARGEIQVGDTVYKLTRDNAYAVHVRDLAVLRERVPTLGSPAPAEPDPRIVVQAVETTDRTAGDEPTPTPTAPYEMASLGVHTNNCHWQSGNYRMHGKSYITNALFYSEAGVSTEWERRKKFLFISTWSNTWQAGTLQYAFSTGNLRLGKNYVVPSSGSGFLTGTSGVHKVIASGWLKQIRGTIYGTHTSSLGQCYTQVGA